MVAFFQWAVGGAIVVGAGILHCQNSTVNIPGLNGDRRGSVWANIIFFSEVQNPSSALLLYSLLISARE